MIEDEISLKEKTAEIKHIIERMPTKFGYWIGAFLLIFFVVLLLFGWLIRYPDIVTGQIIVNANETPVKLISNTNGKLKILVKRSMSSVKADEIIAYIDNAANITDVVELDRLLQQRSNLHDKSELLKLKDKLPYDFSLGDLNAKYYTFIGALQDNLNYQQDLFYEKQIQNLYKLLREQEKAVQNADKRLVMSKKSLSYTSKFYKRDSTLYRERVISEAEFDKTQLNDLSSRDAYERADAVLIDARQLVQQTKSRIQEVEIQKIETEKQLKVALFSSYNDLIDNVKSWKQRYLFLAPFSGRVQFLKFYTENQFIQNGEPVFTVVPKDDNVYGQIVLPAFGSGKIKTGQEVIVKLDNFPFKEFGSITGKVKSISLTTNTETTENGRIETYLITAVFPYGLKTNYNKKLDFKYESKGTAEIVTNNRRLIERLFDNVRYAVVR